MTIRSPEPFESGRLRRLTAGDLSVDLDGVDLRYLRVGATELVRRVYVAVRAPKWEVVPAAIAAFDLEEDTDGFRIDFEAHHTYGDLDFEWRGKIVATAAGPALTYSIDGAPRSEFEFRRIGICVHHPIQTCAGRSFEAIDGDGQPNRGRLPELVAPQLKTGDVYHGLFVPFAELTIASDIGPMRFTFTGDEFEMEDQRNWTDASLKSYSTPLARGGPFRASPSQRIEQSLALDLGGIVPRRSQTRTWTGLEFGERLPHRLPSLGVAIGNRTSVFTPVEVERLRSLDLAHLRVDVDVANENAAASIGFATRVSRAVGCSVEAVLHLSLEDDLRLRALHGALADSPLARVTVVDRLGGTGTPQETTSPDHIALVRTSLGSLDPTIPIGGGTDFAFCELNRRRPDASTMDFVAFPVNPQIHASDTLSLIENLEAQGDAIRTARALFPETPIVVSPITLKGRPALGVDDQTASPGGRRPPSVDERQFAAVAAAWALGSVKYASEAGAAALTYFEARGWRGLMESEAGPAAPVGSPPAPGQVFPVYWTFAMLAGWHEAQLLAVVSSDSLAVTAIALQQQRALRLIVANLTEEVRAAQFTSLPCAATRFERMASSAGDLGTGAERGAPAFETSSASRFTGRIALEPYEVVAIEARSDSLPFG